MALWVIDDTQEAYPRDGMGGVPDWLYILQLATRGATSSESG